MRPSPGEVLHFSEDPSITRFVPHVAATSAESAAYVWAVDHSRAPDYWFPRDCPRAMAWAVPTSKPADVARIVGSGCGERVHVVEYGWLARLLAVRLYAYRFDARDFHPIGSPTPYAHVAAEPVSPLAPPSPVGDLAALHARAGIQLRVLANLWPFWEEAISSSLEFSGIRLRNAVPPPGPGR